MAVGGGTEVAVGGTEVAVGGSEVAVGAGVAVTVDSNLIFVCGIEICVGVIGSGEGIDRGISVTIGRGVRVSIPVTTGTGVDPESIPPHDNIINTSTDPSVKIT